MKGLFNKKRGRDKVSNRMDELVDLIHSSCNEEYPKELKTLVEEGHESSKTLRKALDYREIDLANYLWDHNKTLRSENLINVCSSLQTLKWAKEHNLPFDDNVIYDIMHCWCGCEVPERLSYLFKECGFRVKNHKIWDRISRRGAAYYGIIYHGSYESIIRLAERTCDFEALFVCEEQRIR